MPSLPDSQTVGMTLRACRERAGLSQTQVADRVGMTQPKISRIELGDVDNLSARDLARLVDALSLSDEQILNLLAVFRPSSRRRPQLSEVA
jgi:transcriptional regulator with XRE-family HTH domain